MLVVYHITTMVVEKHNDLWQEIKCAEMKMNRVEGMLDSPMDQQTFLEVARKLRHGSIHVGEGVVCRYI